MPTLRAIAAGACLAIAAVSLRWSASPASEAWSWLVWGREVAHLQLHTTGAAWKPLPVLFTVWLWPLGNAAPYVWLALVRASWLAALLLAHRLGSRLAGRLAGAIAAFGLLLIPSWLTWVDQGLSEPLTIAFVLAAVDRHLAGRRSQALALGCLACLGRPEAWPLAALYWAVVWRTIPGRRALATGLVAAVPLLWLGGLAGAGDPLAAGQHARSGYALHHPELGTTTAAQRVHIFVVATLYLQVLPIWAAAAGAFAARSPASQMPGRSREDRGGLGVGVIAWAREPRGDRRRPSPGHAVPRRARGRHLRDGGGRNRLGAAGGAVPGGARSARGRNRRQCSGSRFPASPHCPSRRQRPRRTAAARSCGCSRRRGPASVSNVAVDGWSS